MTYFYSQNYNQLYNQYGEDYMRAINRHFLSQQKALGKEFWFSHNPATPYPGSSFEMEVNWIKEAYGITSFNSQNLQQVGEYWRLIN